MRNTATGTAEKARENRLRRWAERLGYTLQKDRARKWGIDHQGEYRVVHIDTASIMWGERFDQSLDAVEGFLEQTEADQKAKAAQQRMVAR